LQTVNLSRRPPHQSTLPYQTAQCRADTGANQQRTQQPADGRAKAIEVIGVDLWRLANSGYLLKMYTLVVTPIA